MDIKIKYNDSVIRYNYVEITSIKIVDGELIIIIEDKVRDISINGNPLMPYLTFGENNT